jgi:hypothetical protein
MLPMKLSPLILLLAVPAGAQTVDLAWAFRQAGALARPAAGAKPKAPPVQAADDEAPSYEEVALAYKSIANSMTAAELAIHGGAWKLELRALPRAVTYWAGGYAPKAKGAKPARLVFTQEILESENPYVNGAPVFRVQEEALPLARHPWFEGDPKQVTLDPNEPGKFVTVQQGRLAGKRQLSYDCRAQSDKRLLCKVDVHYETFLISRETVYLGFSR